MSDTTTIVANIEKQKKYTIKIISILFIFSIFISFSILFISIKSRSIYISKENTNFSFKKQNSSILSKDTDIINFLKKNERLIINSKFVDTKSDNFNILNDCIVTTPHIRNKIYRGNTKTIYINNNNRSFFIPELLYLINNDNKQNNYISTKKCNGIFSEKIESNEPFAINDEDLFLSGDNFLFLYKNKYLEITKNTHLIHKKNINENKKQQSETYDIRSVKMEAFGDKKYANFYTNVKFKTNDSIINSQFAKIYLDDENNPTDIFFSKEINAFQEGNNITSDFGYFDIEKNLLILYKNVFIKSENNNSNGEFYFYNTFNKTMISFNENTIFYGKNQSDIYNILQKLAKEVSKSDKDQILQFITKNKKNTVNRAIKYSDNYNIDRTKRTTAILTE